MVNAKGLNIIFCVPFPLTTRDEKRWGIDFFRSKGHAAYVFDFTKVYWTSARRKNAGVPDEVKRDYIFKITDVKDFREALDRVEGRKAVFTDKMPSKRTEKYFNLLNRN